MKLTSEAFALYRLGAEAGKLRREQIGSMAEDQALRQQLWHDGGGALPVFHGGGHLWACLCGLGLKGIEEDP